MKVLDCCAETYKQLTRKRDLWEEENALFKAHAHHPYEGVNKGELSRLKEVVLFAKEHFLDTLKEIRFLAASFADKGLDFVAGYAYSRAVKLLATPPFNGWTVYGGLLREIARFHTRMGDHLQAEAHLRELVKLS